MYYNKHLHPPVTQKVLEHGHTKVVRYMDTRGCSVHDKQSKTNKNINGNRPSVSPKPNSNGDYYRDSGSYENVSSSPGKVSLT
ncbi:hypothetical protein GWI33_007639 [Rhynchophorus ferrugineus]|uniref:Uncharacterized protein n=1 Tax=Rhynchophorus ferrugineus TaxID=354439 RepID=A0A834MGI3_RHYFE|nr:hypothetical protein GWI33_007639 [Rhynchophorus ferrugineus]